MLSVVSLCWPISRQSLKIYLNAIAGLWHKLIAGFISGHVFYRPTSKANKLICISIIFINNSTRQSIAVVTVCVPTVHRDFRLPKSVQLWAKTMIFFGQNLKINNLSQFKFLMICNCQSTAWWQGKGSGWHWYVAVLFHEKRIN